MADTAQYESAPDLAQEWRQASARRLNALARGLGCKTYMVTPVVAVFLQGLSRSSAAAIDLLGSAFAGIVVSDRFSAYNHPLTNKWQLCWAHLIRDLSAIAERQVVSGTIGLELLALQQQLFEHWHHWRDRRVDWPQLQQSCREIRLTFEATLKRVVDLGCERGERTPWAQTVRTCQQLLQRKEALWPFLEKPSPPTTPPRGGCASR